MGLLGGVGEQLNFLIDLNADSAIREAKRFGDTVEKETKRSEDSMSRFSRNAATFGVGAVAFGGAARPAAICRMRPFSITIVTSRCGAAPVPSITVAWVRAVVCAAALPLTSAATANTTRIVARIIPPLNFACFVFSR